LQVNHSFVYKKTAYENHTLQGNEPHWGNRTGDYIPHEFPWLEPFLVALETERKWSVKHEFGTHPWEALFFVEYVDAVPKRIEITFTPSLDYLEVPSMKISQDHPPTLIEAQAWIIANIREKLF
jgi:hypothetical protein